MAAIDPAKIVNSGQRGMYVPHEYGNGLCASDGTMIRKRSSHMPTTTPQEAMTVPVIVRILRIARNGKGRTKLQNTIVQNKGAYVPVCVDQNAGISWVVLPYQTVSRSL